MIDRSFIEKIEEMTGPKTVDTVFGTYSDKRLYRIEDKLVDTISPLYGNGFTQAHWKWCACIRITAILRTAKAFDVKKIDLFCAIVV